MIVHPERDTIVALATAPGRAGIGVLRISGPACRAIAEGVLGAVPQPRHAEYRAFRDAAGEPLDRGLALFFPAPHSFTGEDVLELHAHGGRVLLDMLMARVCELGARAARPGEFSERAFLNDKIDLAQAEAIADLIDAASAQAARGALRTLEGEFSRRVRALVEALTDLRSFIEAAIDFPDEEVDFLSDHDVAGRLGALQARIEALQAGAAQGAALREGLSVVLAGRPNVGKSSLLNALAGRDAAIVTEVPGTTRDPLREPIDLDGLPLHVIDTAGLRDSDDPVEREGVRRAWAAVEGADRVLLVVDDALGEGAEEAAIRRRLPAALPVSVVRNKIDLSGRAPGERHDGDGVELCVSARTGAGLDALRVHLQACAGYAAAGEDVFTARRRHLQALERARAALLGARTALAQGPELAAEDLRQAQRALGEITGEVTTEDLLGRIFASFCIGK